MDDSTKPSKIPITYQISRFGAGGGAVFPSSGMVLMNKRTPPPGAYVEGVGRGRRQRVLVESM